MKTILHILCLSLVGPLSAPAASYYLNPATGNDASAGTAPSTAWQTAARLNTALSNGTIAGAAWPWTYANGTAVSPSIPSADLLAGIESGEIVFGAGDTVYIDTSAEAWAMTVGINVSNKSGIRLTTATPGARAQLTAFKTIAASGWTAAPGLSGVYRTSDTETASVLWEDRKWLTHPNGTTLAAVQSALVSTAGSFWTDGTTLYVHPISGDNPATSGKTYERSRALTGAHDCAVFIYNSHDCVVDSLSIGGTCMALASDGQPATSGGGRYAIYAEGSNQVVSNCDAFYTEKHGISMIGGTSGKWFLIQNCESVQGSAYSGAGGQTPFVFFGSTNVTIHMRRCTCTADSGLLGSTAGTARPLNIPAVYAHNLVNSPILISDSDFSGTNVGGEAPVTLQRTRVGMFSGGTPSTADGCFFDGYGFQPTTGTTYTILNSIWKPAAVVPFVVPAGTLIFDGCTLDGSLLSADPTGFIAFLWPGVGLNLTMRNSVYLGSSVGNVLLFFTWSTLPGAPGSGGTNTLTLSHNVYRTGSTATPGKLGLYANNYTGNYYLSPADLAALDSGSVTADPTLDANYRPQSGSPALGRSSGAPNPRDYSGVIHPARTASGAMEPALPANTLGVRP